MVRAAAFGFFASGVWALLPLVARHTLGLGSGGYGLLLGAVGIGAVLGATFSPAIRRALSPRALMAACAAAIAGIGAGARRLARRPCSTARCWSLAGAGWILALGLLNASFQSTLPSWVKARGMAFYTVAFQGATGTGALALGAVAQATSLDDRRSSCSPPGSSVGAAATFRLSLPQPGPDRRHAGRRDAAPGRAGGRRRPGIRDRELQRRPRLARTRSSARTDRLKHFRQRTGGMRVAAVRRPDTPGRYLETFLVGSWDEHERQHMRMTKHDRQLLEEIDKLLVAGTHREAHHYLTAPPPR